MVPPKQNSRRRYYDFIKAKGILKFKKNLEEEKKDSAKDENAVRKNAGYYLWRYISEFREHRSKIILIILLGLFNSLLGALFPWTSKVMIDYILPQKNIVLLSSACLALLVSAAMQRLLTFSKDYYSQILLGRFVLGLKQRQMEHLNTLPLVELQKMKIGGIISRLQDDSEGSGNLLFNGLLTPFNALIMFLIAIISLLVVNWKVMLICFIFCMIMFGITYFVFNIMRPFQRSLRQDRALINAGLAETFGGIQVIRSFRRENTIRKDYGTDINLLWRKSLYSFVIGSSVHIGAWTVFSITEISIWLVGGYFFINGTLSVGSIVVFISFTQWLFQPIFQIMFSFSEMQKSMACVERTFDLLDMKPDIVDKENTSNIVSFNEGIKFDNVDFVYPDGTKALDNVNFFIPKGKVMALVGPSGGGKTTLSNIVLRFYDVSSGSVSVDGTDIRNLSLSCYRSLMSLVLQDVFLFDGTIRENILFGNRNASEKELLHAAEVAHCHEFIDKLKDKYDTVIGERGVKLSGGQKQRIALARALIANPQLLILDEATSNLDSESEGLIQDALKKIFRDRTTIVIAHRLSTIIDADSIVVIDKGRILEQGSHFELLEKKGKYFDMYNKQMEKSKSIQNLWNAESAAQEEEEEK
ncbi:MAG: hypothetical protein A2017_11295 [Lentisphaerae bacterium GWF2_44_16]|nr:MAG: hypothetical protein A2017_11295 [Lentisphaerae bacterium GWF2_44_16]